jgi:hypothetical protein
MYLELVTNRLTSTSTASSSSIELRIRPRSPYDVAIDRLRRALGLIVICSGHSGESMAELQLMDACASNSSMRYPQSTLSASVASPGLVGAPSQQRCDSDNHRASAKHRGAAVALFERELTASLNLVQERTQARTPRRDERSKRPRGFVFCLDPWPLTDRRESNTPQKRASAW